MKFWVAASIAAASAAVLLKWKMDGQREAEKETAACAPECPETLETELRERMEEFLDRDRFSLMVQPVVDFRNARVCNGEVLSRLNHPEGCLVFPDVFLPLVDELGLYPRFDRYIFRKTCAWMRRSLDAGESFDALSCNFSRKTLSEAGLAQDLIEIADSYGVERSRLALEVTEREQETDTAQFIDNLKQLKAAGFRIILDDYGNGVTSVRDLMDYPLDIVKIDRSLLLHTQTEQGRAAYRALVAMAAELGAEVVCEGIETEEQSRFARDAGCHYGQGFLFFRPIAQDQVFEQIRRSSLSGEEG